MIKYINQVLLFPTLDYSHGTQLTLTLGLFYGCVIVPQIYVVENRPE